MSPKLQEIVLVVFAQCGSALAPLPFAQYPSLLGGAAVGVGVSVGVAVGPEVGVGLTGVAVALGAADVGVAVAPGWVVGVGVAGTLSQKAKPAPIPDVSRLQVVPP